MTGLLLQIGATKLVISVVLAGAAWIVHRRVGLPAVSYPLWLLVLATLLVPAVVSLPVLPAESGAPLAGLATDLPEVVLADAVAETANGPRLGVLVQPGLAIIWLLGTAGLLGWTLLRTARFQRTLAKASRRAPARIQHEAAGIGHKLGLARIPEVRITEARVTPMVWWTGGKVRVLVPDFLLIGMVPGELHAILAHELAHVRRRDHLVRWLEWLACSAFWWNPVAWWVRRQLRIAEESCCDRLALGSGCSSPRTYAKALLRVVSGVPHSHTVHPPVPASAASGVGRTRVLERRLRMIISTDISSPAPRRLRAATFTALLCALPFGLVYCTKATAPTAPEEEAAVSEEEVLAGPEAELGAEAEMARVRERLVATIARIRTLQQHLVDEVESTALIDARNQLRRPYYVSTLLMTRSNYQAVLDYLDQNGQAAARALLERRLEAARIEKGTEMLAASIARLREVIEHIERSHEGSEMPPEVLEMLAQLNELAATGREALRRIR